MTYEEAERVLLAMDGTERRPFTEREREAIAVVGLEIARLKEQPLSPRRQRALTLVELVTCAFKPRN